jgi:hypothetical protein
MGTKRRYRQTAKTPVSKAVYESFNRYDRKSWHELKRHETVVARRWEHGGMRWESVDAGRGPAPS